jgi:ABC-type Fe3+/spermidine/putrescine transport system ATPase subunit
MTENSETRQTEPALTLNDLEVGYGPFTVLRGLSLFVLAGESVALIGTNGAGKSTVLKAVAGFVRPRRGSIKLMGKDISGLRPPSPPAGLRLRGPRTGPLSRNVCKETSKWAATS